ncbi:MAG: ATP-binding protein [Bdellovibrionota bacterium]
MRHWHMLLLDRIPVRFRLSFGHALWLAVLFLGVGFGLYRVVEVRVLDSVDAALLSSARSVRDARFPHSRDKNPVEIFFKHFFRDPLYVDQLFSGRFVRPYAQLINMSGEVRSKTDNLLVALPVTPKAVGRAEHGLVTFENFRYKNRPPMRQITMPVMSLGKFTGELVQVGASLEHIYQNLHEIALVLIIGFSLGLIGSIFFGYVLAKRALSPVQNISKAAGDLGIDDLSVRLPLPSANDELRELSVTFNAMLDRLEEAVKRLRRFTGDVSHELRTPLAVLRGEAELALRRDRSSDEYKNTLKTINHEAVHMTKIVEDLLLLAKAEAKSVAMNWVSIPIDAFIYEVVGHLSTIFKEKEIELKVNIQSSAGEVCISQNLLALALKNLLVNACKHSKADSIVEINAFGGDSDVYFEVADFGEGIPEESLPLIFDSFYRADTARNRAAGGVGIGLSLAKALVKLHGGELTVSSVYGEGSKFVIKLPRNLDKLSTPSSNTLSSNTSISQNSLLVEPIPQI